MLINRFSMSKPSTSENTKPGVSDIQAEVLDLRHDLPHIEMGIRSILDRTSMFPFILIILDQE